jgi:hypothetical protein
MAGTPSAKTRFALIPGDDDFSGSVLSLITGRHGRDSAKQSLVASPGHDEWITLR